MTKEELIKQIQILKQGCKDRTFPNDLIADGAYNAYCVVLKLIKQLDTSNFFSCSKTSYDKWRDCCE